MPAHPRRPPVLSHLVSVAVYSGLTAEISGPRSVSDDARFPEACDSQLRGVGKTVPMRDVILSPTEPLVVAIERQTGQRIRLIASAGSGSMSSSRCLRQHRRDPAQAKPIRSTNLSTTLCACSRDGWPRWVPHTRCADRQTRRWLVARSRLAAKAPRPVPHLRAGLTALHPPARGRPAQSAAGRRATHAPWLKPTRPGPSHPPWREPHGRG